MNKNDKNEIINLLQRFQAGYTFRDLSKVDVFVSDLFLETNEILVIGTSAVNTSSEEWCVGQKQVKKIIEDDWKYWGEVEYDIENADIMIDHDIACVGMIGTVKEIIKKENYYQYRLELIHNQIKQEIDSKQKLIEILQGISDTLSETEQGEEYIWPTRLSMVLMKENYKWKIKQLHFSYPITFYPQVRV